MPRAFPAGRAWMVWPVVLTLTLLAPVIYFLLERIPGRVEQPLATMGPGSQPGSVRLLGLPRGSGTSRTIAYHLKLTARDISRIVSHTRIELLTVSDRENLLIGSAEMRVSGTDCVYRAAPGTPFPVNDFLSFVRRDGCVPLTGTATGELELTVNVAAIARLDVLTVQAPLDAPPEHATLIVSGQAPDAPLVHAVRGRFVDPYPARTERRVRLLNYVWQVSPSPAWIWIVIGAAGVLLLVGNAFFWAPAFAGGRPSPLVKGAAAACIASALGLGYAVLTPPFQTPDEPAHFIAFTTFIGRLELGNETTLWARDAHFERIQFHVHEKFGPFDMETPGTWWNDGAPPSAEVRGSGIFHFWRAISRPIRSASAPHLLITLRAMNVAVFAFVVGCFVAATLLLTNVASPHLLAFPLFLLPTLPFFAMHVSNYALLVSAYIVIALGVLVWFLDGPRSAFAGPLIGVGWAAGILLSRSAIPLAPLVGALYAGRLVLGGQDRSMASTLLFWGGAGLTFVVAVVLADAEYVRTMSNFGTAAGAAALTAAGNAVTTHPGLIVAGVAAAAVAERLCLRAMNRMSPIVAPWARSVSTWAMTLTAAAVVLLLAASLFVPMPTMERIDPARPPAPSAYVRDTVLTALTMFRLSRPDFFTSTSFWGGFGWLETQADWRFISALAVTTGAAFVWLMLWIRRTRDARLSARLMLTVCGFAASIGAYAYTLVRLTPADVVGRYLFGSYLAMLLVCWSPLALARLEHVRGTHVVPWIPALASMGAHAYCLTVLLRRYF